MESFLCQIRILTLSLSAMFCNLHLLFSMPIILELQYTEFLQADHASVIHNVASREATQFMAQL